MTAKIDVTPGDKEKLSKVVKVTNQTHGLSIQVVGYENGKAIISFESINDVWLLGRVFEPYEMPQKMGSITIYKPQSEI